MWFVSWDVIYHKSTPSKTRFFPLSLLQKVTSTSEPILFSSQQAPFLSLWNIFLFFMDYYSTSSFIWLPFLLRFLLNAFLQYLKISHMHFINKNGPAKRDETFIWGKKVSPKQDPGFMNVGSLLGGRIYFHINRFWFYNRILLQSEISLNRDIVSPYKHPLSLWAFLLSILFDLWCLGKLFY